MNLPNLARSAKILKITTELSAIPNHVIIDGLSNPGQLLKNMYKNITNWYGVVPTPVLKDIEELFENVNYQR